MPAADYQKWAVQELKALIPFDAAIWGMGNARRGKFHNVSVIGLPSNFATVLEQTREINPMYGWVSQQIGRPHRMEDELADADFYTGELYHRCFSQFGIERLLTTSQADARSGLYTLLTLYRFDRDQPFTDKECDIQAQASYHMVSAYSHAFFLHLSRPQRKGRRRVAAVVDREGVLHEVDQGFVGLLEKHYPDWQGMNLPFEWRSEKASYKLENLCIEVEPLADLYLVKLHEQGPLDSLTPREREVVFAVCRGLSHKAIGKELGLAPTTVSSHLYRAYSKLGVESRSALARLIHDLG
ncbi:MAG: response regulator transcription factor [Nevskiales bacterium]